MKDADVPVVLRRAFDQPDLEIKRGELAKVGDASLYAELVTPGGGMALYIVCQAVQQSNVALFVSVTGNRPHDELHKLLDRVTSSLKRR